MIAEAMEKFKEMTHPPVVEIDGQSYRKNNYSLVTEPMPEVLEAVTLTSIVDYLKNKIDDRDPGNLYIHIADHQTVTLNSHITSTMQRPVVVRARALTNNFKFGNPYNYDAFAIAMRSQFQQTEDKTYILNLISSLSAGSSKTLKDDGVSQTVHARAGISLKEEVSVKNPVFLQPFRTFPEVEQPKSEFLFRMKQQADEILFSLHECDGSAWKLEAIQNIAVFFSTEMPHMPVIA